MNDLSPPLAAAARPDYRAGLNTAQRDAALHGSGPGASGYSNYKKNMPAFAEAGYYAVAPDLPGFGLSDKPSDIDYTSTLHVQAMAELVESLGVSAVVPIGNSLGGSVALEFALTAPQRALMANAYRAAGAEAVAGFRNVLAGLKPRAGAPRGN